MNSNDSILRRLLVALAVMCAFLVFGAGGAQAAPAQAVAASGSLAAQDSDEPSDEDSDEPSDEEDSTDDPDEDDSDSEDSDEEDSDSEDSESEEPSDEPTPTFTDPNDGATDDITEMPTEDAGTTSEAGPSPLGWILLGGGVACAAAAIVVYRRNRGF